MRAHQSSSQLMTFCAIAVVTFAAWPINLRHRAAVSNHLTRLADFLQV